MNNDARDEFLVWLQDYLRGRSGLTPDELEYVRGMLEAELAKEAEAVAKVDIANILSVGPFTY